VEGSEFDRMRDDFEVRPGEDLSHYEKPHWIVRAIVYLWLGSILVNILLQLLYFVSLVANHN
jgi:hypothetical protein